MVVGVVVVLTRIDDKRLCRGMPRNASNSGPVPVDTGLKKKSPPGELTLGLAPNGSVNTEMRTDLRIESAPARRIRGVHCRAR